MGSVVILGAGELGGAVAHALAVRDRVGRVLLIDPAGTAAEGKALDIRQSAPVDRFHAGIDGASDSTRAAGPLLRAPDAIYVDTTGLEASAVIDRLEAEVRKRRRAEA